MGADQKFMTAQQLITRNLHVAKTEDRKVKLYSMVFHPDGDITVGGIVVTPEAALTILEDDRNSTAVKNAVAASAPIKKINTATKIFMKSLWCTMEELEQKSLILGVDFKVLPQDQPRLTNLKKMGYVVTEEVKVGGRKRKELSITELGWEALKS